ncbi:MAG: hypothetical protein SGJ07_00510 [Rhodospirillaceae bacterium]|nr:hypothetical protein [Rhodospirillaceae bacterium]
MNDPAGYKLVVAYLPRGIAYEVANGLYERLQLSAFHYGHGRASSMLDTITGSEMAEVDILSVVVTEAQAEEAFAFIYEAGQIDRPGGGLITQLSLGHAAITGLPLLEEPAA